MKNVSIKVANTAKLPLAILRGTEKQRYSLSDNYFKALREKVLNEKDVLTLSSYKEMINSVLPENSIDLKIIKNKNKKILGGLAILPQLRETPAEIQVTQIGYSMRLPMKNNKITDKLTALHEARHFFDHICNPKTVVNRSYKLYENDEAYNKRSVIFEMFMRNYSKNVEMNDFKQEVRSRISELDSDVIIDLLQDLRSSLRTEVNAYNGDFKMLMKSPFKNYIEIVNLLYTMNFILKFKQKLNFANKLLLEQLNLQRMELKRNSLKK